MNRTNRNNNSRNFRKTSNNSHYTKYNSYYNNTSEALKYAPNYLPDYQPEIRRKPKTKIKEKYVRVEKNERIFSLNFLLTVVIFSTIAISIVGINAKILQKKFEIDELNVQLKEIKESNANLETEIAKNLDLEYIENYASKNLKMQKPATHQIVHISVPKESYTIKNNSNNKTE